jgi:hypothetical protein
MGPGLPPSLQASASLGASLVEALAETGAGATDYTRFIDTVTFGPFLMV